MAFLGRTILLIAVLVCLSGCTFHFKASELEVSGERQRVKSNHTYELEKVDFLVRTN